MTLLRLRFGVYLNLGREKEREKENKGARETAKRVRVRFIGKRRFDSFSTILFATIVDERMSSRRG